MSTPFPHPKRRTACSDFFSQTREFVHLDAQRPSLNPSTVHIRFLKWMIWGYLHLTYIYIYIYIYLFIYSFIYLFIYSFIYLFIYLFIHLFIYTHIDAHICIIIIIIISSSITIIIYIYMWLIYGYGSEPQPRSYPKSYVWFFLEFFLDGYSPGHMVIFNRFWPPIFPLEDGNDCYSLRHWSHGPVEIVDLSIENSMIFQFAM